MLPSGLITSLPVIVLRVSEFVTADGGATLNAASEQIIFQMAQPGGHNNGGHLLFGPDGHLYLGIGDGGNDESERGHTEQTSNHGPHLGRAAEAWRFPAAILQIWRGQGPARVQLGQFRGGPTGSRAALTLREPVSP